MKIRPADFVLEVGSGHNPKARSNVLCDRFIDVDTERGAEIWQDRRPLVAADAQALPFADGSFDYVICAHVLEHVEDPVRLAQELQRVAPRGYIESPSEIAERLYGWPYHRWFVNLADGKLILREKDAPSQFGQLFHLLFAHDRDFGRFHASHPRLLLVELEWEGEIPLGIVGPGESVLDLESRHAIEAIALQRVTWSRRLVLSLKAALSQSWRVRLKSFVPLRHQAKTRSLQEIVVCPACRGDVAWHTERILCQQCGREYPIRNGIPRLLVEPL